MASAAAPKTYAILNCEDSPDWPSFYTNLVDLPWECSVHHVWQGPAHFPSLDDLAAHTQAIIITGSLSAAYDTAESSFVPAFRTWLSGFFSRFYPRGFLVPSETRRPRVLGICFGHQIIAHVCGGIAARNTQAEWGQRELTLSPRWFEMPYVQAAGVLARKRFYYPWLGDEAAALQAPAPAPAPAAPAAATPAEPAAAPSAVAPSAVAPPAITGRTIHAIETHGDHVAVPPPEALVLATSLHTKVEAMALGTEVLTTQFHPEFTSSTPSSIILPLINSRAPLPTDQFKEWAEADFSLETDQCAYLRAVVRAFLYARTD
ncbi:hypothetical protein PAPYR_10901 [Paratrimastix pyriformis]|uniref:Glutamine amidotransferase domain-containing protein n=1 Tax=Paratrimastix pyriformis TaxID=342808 RepID=A0ABQ8U4X0_9EUKA|nr:hypothetical protein PAPYR_10901 [Paratrimastix pyriformis]